MFIVTLSDIEKTQPCLTGIDGDSPSAAVDDKSLQHLLEAGNEQSLLDGRYPIGGIREGGVFSKYDITGKSSYR